MPALIVDDKYPGTSVERMLAARERASSLAGQLSGEWEPVRQKILWAAGLKDLQSAQPGMGYTGHAFNDNNHCDATCMLGDVAHNLNEEGANRIKAIAVGNRLGPGIEIATLPELGQGGSWSTCTNGCHLEPPQASCASYQALLFAWPRALASHFLRPHARRTLPTSSSAHESPSSSCGARRRSPRSCSSTMRAVCW